jgi:hypothetical protein
MTQAEMERELSHVTGETVGEIRRRGFSLIVMPDRGPLTIDWDQVQEVERVRYVPPRPVRRRSLAA